MVNKTPINGKILHTFKRMIQGWQLSGMNRLWAVQYQTRRPGEKHLRRERHQLMSALVITGLVALEELGLTPQANATCISELGLMGTCHRQETVHT